MGSGHFVQFYAVKRTCDLASIAQVTKFLIMSYLRVQLAVHFLLGIYRSILVHQPTTRNRVLRTSKSQIQAGFWI